MTLAELKASYLVTGQGVESATWDATWREKLVDYLSELVAELWVVPMTGRIFINGSFVTIKDHPGDIDGYFECPQKSIASRELNRALNARNAHQIWVWDPQAFPLVPGFGTAKPPMWHRYRVELFPEDPIFQMPAINTQAGMLPFSVGFRLTRTGSPKGIIEIVQRSTTERQERRQRRQDKRRTRC